MNADTLTLKVKLIHLNKHINQLTNLERGLMANKNLANARKNGKFFIIKN